MTNPRLKVDEILCKVGHKSKISKFGIIQFAKIRFGKRLSHLEKFTVEKYSWKNTDWKNTVRTNTLWENTLSVSDVYGKECSGSFDIWEGILGGHDC